MPNNNVLTDAERNAIERAISEVELCCQFSLANELRALLAAHPGQPEPASRGVIAAALAVIAADRSQTLTNEPVDALENAIKIQRGELTPPEPHAEVDDWNAPCTRCSTPRACQYDGCRNDKPRAEVTEEQPSLTNPLTPYGMLVRALRIVAQTSLYDMGQALLLSPAKLSAMEFGREPVTPEIVREVGTYFESLGVHNVRPALQFAADGAGGDTLQFESRDERDEFIRACQDFDDDGETCVDYGLLMKWASDGLLDCDHFTITKKGRAAIDAARSGASS